LFGCGYIEFSNSKSRDGLFDKETFKTLQEAKVLLIDGVENIIIFDPTVLRITDNRDPRLY
jgi:hypothetical protein